LVALLSSAVCVLSLVACTVGPKYVKPSVPTPPAFKELVPPDQAATGTWKTAAPQDDALRGKWWEIYEDPQLNELEEKLNVANQNIAAAAANFMAARAVVRQAWSQYFPTVTVNPSIMYSRPSPAQFAGLKTNSASGAGVTVSSFTSFSLPFDASWELDLWGRVRNQVRANAFAAQASAADLANVRLSSQAELAADYYQLRGQDALKQLLNSTVIAYQQSLSLTQSRFKAGLDSEEAVAQAEALLRAAEAQDTNLGILRAQFEHAIAVLVGQPPSTFSLAFNALEASPPPIPAGLPSELLERRPDIAAMERTMAQANAQIGVAKAAYFPTVTLSATAGFGNSSFINWATWPSRFWSVGPALAQTIFDAGLRRATARQYEATYDQAVANYRQTVLTAFQQVEDSLAALRILTQVIEEQDAAVHAAQRNLRVATVRYQAGIDPYLNVITAQTILLNDEQAAVNYRIQHMVSSVQLIKALGGGWQLASLPSSKEVLQH
jgi:NodT family efflux transporter outer membrane factor (OMF) lipoprotein